MEIKINKTRIEKRMRSKMDDELVNVIVKLKKTNPVFYLKGINYLLESLFLIQHLTRFRSTLNFFEEELNNQKFLINENTESLAFLYLYLNKINLYFLEGNFNLGLYDSLAGFLELRYGIDGALRYWDADRVNARLPVHLMMHFKVIDG